MTLEQLQQIRETADAFPSSVGQLLDSLGLALDGLTDSPSALEVAEHDQIQAQRTVNAQAWMLLETGGDYLFALPRLVAEPALPIAMFACARGVLEACSQVHWLLDANCSSQDRLARSLSLRFRDITEQLKLSRVQGDALTVLDLASRLRILQNVAATRGVTAKHDKTGKLSAVGPPIPKATLLAARLNAEVHYRWLSGVVHSQGAFILASAFKRTDRTGITEKNLEPEVAAELLTLSVTWFARASWEYCHHMGVADRLVPAIELAYDQLALPAGTRFWRNV